MLSFATHLGWAAVGLLVLTWIFHDWRTGSAVSDGGDIDMAKQPIAFAIETAIQAGLAAACFWKAFGLDTARVGALLRSVLAHI